MSTPDYEAWFRLGIDRGSRIEQSNAEVLQQLSSHTTDLTAVANELIALHYMHSNIPCLLWNLVFQAQRTSPNPPRTAGSADQSQGNRITTP
jgi:hypothetical protein